MIPLNKRVNNFITNYQVGQSVEYVNANNYLKLFSFEMSSEWKASYVLFYYSDTQSPNFSGICNIGFRKGSSTSNIEIVGFKTLNFLGNLSTKLFAVITETNKAEVYVKVQSNESPTLNIMNISKHFNADLYGKLTIDCKTVVSSLPSGTQKTPTNLL